MDISLAPNAISVPALLHVAGTHSKNLSATCCKSLAILYAWCASPPWVVKNMIALGRKGCCSDGSIDLIKLA